MTCFQIYAVGGDILYTFGLALVWSLAFESPLIIIEKVIFGMENTKKKQETLPPPAGTNGKAN